MAGRKTGNSCCAISSWHQNPTERYHIRGREFQIGAKPYGLRDRDGRIITWTKRCSRCRVTWYCSVEHQKEDWKRHKKATCNDAFQADQHTLHKEGFDRIIKKYSLDSDAKSTEIAEFLTSAQDPQDNKVSAAAFAEKFGTTNEEAVVFLEWIKVGIKFKEESLDAAKKAGFSGSR